MVATRLVMPIFDCFARHGSLRADRAVWPPTSSSLRDEKHVPLLLLSTAARDPIFDCFARHGSLRADRAVWPPTSSSLRDEKHVPSLLLSTTARDPIFDCFRSPRLTSAAFLLTD